jgi:hypothetical protein
MDWSGADAVALEDSNGDAVVLEISSADEVTLGLLARMVTLGLLARLVTLELLSQMVALGLLGADTVTVVGVAWAFIAFVRETYFFFKRERFEVGY